MILDFELELDKDGKNKSPLSSYNPDEPVKDITLLVQNNFEDGRELHTKSYGEFNDKSLVSRMNMDQKAFNNFEPSPSDDPDEEWRSTAVRPIVRNKIIGIAAHITANLIFPKIFAQNEEDEEDRDAAEVMKDLMEWVADRSDYAKKFLYAVIASLVNPASVVHVEYNKVMRTVTNIDGNKEEIEDSALSGFQFNIVPLDELYIENIYEHDIQKQGYLIWRKAISYSTAKIKYSDHENFKYITPGIKNLLSEDDGLFYEAYDKSSDRLVEEVIYYDRNKDLELIFVNGVIMTEPDRPNPRIDKKYPFIKGGYELVDEGRFFYYKSLAFKTMPDYKIVNNLYRMIFDGSIMKLMPPIATFGGDIVDTGIIFPGGVTTFNSPDASIKQIDVGIDLNAGFKAIEMAEGSINESSQDPMREGQGSSGQQTAFEISTLEQNSKIQLGLFGKMIGFMVKDWGELMQSDIVQHLTVGEMKEIVGESGAMKFRSFLIPDMKSGDTRKRVKFDPDMPDQMTDEQVQSESFGLLEEEGNELDPKMEIWRVNPAKFRSLQFQTRISPDIIFPPSDRVKKALMLEEYDRAVQNPRSNQDAILKDLLYGAYEKTADNPEKYIAPEQQAPQQGGDPGAIKAIMGEQQVT